MIGAVGRRSAGGRLEPGVLFELAGIIITLLGVVKRDKLSTKEDEEAN